MMQLKHVLVRPSNHHSTSFLGPKLYCFGFENNQIEAKAKGVAKRTHGELTYDNFVTLLDPLKTFKAQSVHFNMYSSMMLTCKQTKLVRGIQLKR